MKRKRKTLGAGAYEHRDEVFQAKQEAEDAARHAISLAQKGSCIKAFDAVRLTHREWAIADANAEAYDGSGGGDEAASGARKAAVRALTAFRKHCKVVRK